MAKAQWQIDQGNACTCKGHDEWCPCQNVNRAEPVCWPNDALTSVCEVLMDEYELTQEQIASLAKNIPGECRAIADNRSEAAYESQHEALMEGGGPDDSAYRRDMQNAGRGHLLR